MNSSSQRRRSFPKRLFINSRMQISLLASIWIIAIIGMIIAALLCAWFYASSGTAGTSDSGGWAGLNGRIAMSILVLLVIMAWLSLFLTHRVAGPVYRIMRRLESMAEGNLQESMRLRRKDQFQELAEQLNVTIESLRQEREKSHQQAAMLAQKLEELAAVLARDEGDAGDLSAEQKEALARAQKICSELTGIS